MENLIRSKGFALTQKNHFIILKSIGHLFFFLAMIWSICYYKERMIAFDSSFYCFKLIYFKIFNVELERSGAIPTQILPLWGIKKGMALKSILELYSFSFILLHYIFYILIVHVLRNIWAGIALCFALCLNIRFVAYYSPSELLQAISPILLIGGIITCNSTNSPLWKKLFYLILSFAAIWYISRLHVIASFAIVFILGFEIIRNKRWKDPLLLLILLLTFGWFAYVILSIPVDSYQGKKLIGYESFIKLLPTILQLPSTKYFLDFAGKYFLTSLVIFCSIFTYFIYKKKHLLNLYVISFIIGFLLIIFTTYANGESPIMLEHYYVLIGIFIGFPFCIEFLPNIPKYFSIMMVVILLFFNMKGVLNSHHFYKQRNEYIERITDYGRKFPEKKFIVNEGNLDWSKVWVDWDMAFESLLLSSLKGPDSAVTFYTTSKPNEYDTLLNNKNLFIGVDFAAFWFSSNSFDQHYFRLQNTFYKKLNTDQDDSLFNEKNFSKENVQITLQTEYRESRFDFMTIPIKIKNLSEFVLPSHLGLKHPVYLSYHLYNKKGVQIVADGRRTIFEVDLLPNHEYTQGLIIDYPKKSGEFVLEVDILTENVRWWGINKRASFIIE